MPVIGSNLAFRCEMVHKGLTRRSEVAAGEVMRIGMSLIVAGAAMLTEGTA